MVMTFSLDIRDFDDLVSLWVHVILQQLSVITGCFANITSNYTLAVILLVLSCLSFSSIYIAVYFSFRRIEFITKETVINENYAQNRQIPVEISHIKTNQIMQELTPIKISQILSKVENIGVTMSFQLVLICAFCWTIIAITYFVGLFHFISDDTDACIQAAVDFLTKCCYVQVLCTTHGAVLSPEGIRLVFILVRMSYISGILIRLLVLEEKANAAFKQVRVYHFTCFSDPSNLEHSIRLP